MILKETIRRWWRFAVPARHRLWLKFQFQALEVRWRAKNYEKRVKALRRNPKKFRGLTIFIIYPEIGAPSRYRVFNQAKQLKLMGLKPVLYNIDNLEVINDLTKADLLYLYRVEATPLTQKLVELAHHQQIPIIFDTDDLIWDQKLVDYGQLKKHWPAEDVKDYLNSVERHKLVMQQVDYFVVSTPFLAHLIETEFNKKTYVNRNALSEEAHILATSLYETRQAKSEFAPAKQVVIGYFSGTLKAHEEDFRLIEEPLRQVLQEHPYVKIKIVGYLERENLLPGYEDRIQYHPLVEWPQMFELLNQVDINLAPLIDNPHRRCKSAVKFLEAALIGVPTVASNLDPYQEIKHGETGFLATTPVQWHDYLLELIDTPELRSTMGRAARDQVLAQDTVQIRAYQFEQTLRNIVEDHCNTCL